MKNDRLSFFRPNKYLNKSHSGFTIVELLVVIVVIAILAAISIVSYTGISRKAAIASLKSDLRNSSTQLALYNTLNSLYPADLAAATAVRTLPASPDTTYQYTLTDGSYCLSATSPKAGNSAYHYSSLVGTIESGVCSGHNEPGAVNVELLIVAGGGGGSTSNGGGGGGAGGVLNGNIVALSVGTHPVVVGLGGATNVNGNNSFIDNIVAIGGGRGATVYSNNAGIGGSGGGGHWDSFQDPGAIGAIGTVGQGHNGGNGGAFMSGTYFGGGGGGASTAGGNAINNGVGGGVGGAGIVSSINGSPVYYGGGGGGDGDYTGATNGIGGIGGGGNGGVINGRTSTAGGDNTGGGGGGGGNDGGGRAGGSGMVIIRYLTGSMSANGGAETFSGLYTIRTFTSSGTFTIN